MYVFDTSVFYVLRVMTPDRFPTIWKHLDELSATEELVSTREVLHELERHSPAPHVDKWVADNRAIFAIPTDDELAWVKRLFQTRGNMGLVKRKNLLNGWPVADPFVIACAKAKDATLVTEEGAKKVGARIPSVAKPLGIKCTDFNGFMSMENLKY